MDEQFELVFDLLAEPVQSEFQPDDWSVWHEMTMLRNENYALRQCVADLLRLAQWKSRGQDKVRADLLTRLLSLRAELVRTGRLPGAPEIVVEPSALR